MRLPTLTLTALLVALPALAQESTTHNSAITIGDTTYLVNTWISADGSRSTTSVRAVELPTFQEFTNFWKEARAASVRQRDAKRARKMAERQAEDLRKAVAAQVRAEQDSALRIARVRPAH